MFSDFESWIRKFEIQHYSLTDFLKKRLCLQLQGKLFLDFILGEKCETSKKFAIFQVVLVKNNYNEAKKYE